MRITPLPLAKAKPWALLTPGQRELGVVTMNGESLFRGRRSVENALTKLAPYVCYVGHSLERLKHTTGATSWEMSTWKGRETSMHHVPSGVRVTSLRGTLEASLEPARDLAAFLEWIGRYGVVPASVSSMAWQLFRASLTETLYVASDPQVSRPAFFGPRQEVETPGTFYDVECRDLRAAYPSAMSERPFALGLREVSASTRLDASVAGLAEASVVVLHENVHPLPVRLGPETIQFQSGLFSGTWPWCELAAAKAAGADVIVSRVWAPTVEVDLFTPWWIMASTGRYVPGAAATLAKAVANTLWGQTAMRGDQRSIVRWESDRGNDPNEVEVPPRALPHPRLVHLAAAVTARVRGKTLAAMAHLGDDVLHVDTDGVLVRRGAPALANTGECFGQWGVKKVMEEVEIRAPQFYRYREPGSLRWRYCASGMSEGAAEVTFSRSAKRATKVAYMADPDTILPPGSSFEDYRAMAS